MAFAPELPYGDSVDVVQFFVSAILQRGIKCTRIFFIK